MSAAKVELGRRLFYDTRLSGNGAFSCASCHRQEFAFADARNVPVGSTGEAHTRNSMALANVGYFHSLGWADPRTLRLEAQALIPMFGDVPVELGLKGRRPTSFTVDEAGIPPYNELVLVTSETTLNEKRDEIRSFIGALARGTRLAQREPEVAAGFLSRANRELDPKLQLEGTKKTPFAQPAGKPFGYQDPEQWKRFAEFMTTSGAVEGELNVDEAFTNDLLPGGGAE